MCINKCARDLSVRALRVNYGTLKGAAVAVAAAIAVAVAVAVAVKEATAAAAAD